VEKEALKRTTSFAGKHVTIIGLAREGVALTRCLAARGALITVSDLKPREALADAIEALSSCDVRFVLGGHPPEILDCDVLFISPGVPLDIPILREAVKRGIPLSSESRFFLENCPSPVIGVTGSSGKTTTVSLVGEMLKTSGFKTWVGGNIGRPLTPFLDEIRVTDKVVMELSSFQLQLLQTSPELAAILNITPNHLDRHASMEEYIEAKSNILRFQRGQDAAVLNYDNAETRKLARLVKGKLAWFSTENDLSEAQMTRATETPPAASLPEGGFFRKNRLMLRLGDQEMTIVREGDVQLRGRHNLQNVAAACTIAGLAGASVEAMAEVISGFQGVEHRLELVREVNGVRYYNDSIATSPERSAAALRAFDEPIVLLAGGQDKHLPWDEWAVLALERTSAVVLFGQAADIIEDALGKAIKRGQLGAHERPAIHSVKSLEEAVSLAHSLARAGDVVLLSPGGASFDAFKDFEARGRHFKELVEAL